MLVNDHRGKVFFLSVSVGAGASFAGGFSFLVLAFRCVCFSIFIHPVFLCSFATFVGGFYTYLHLPRAWDAAENFSLYSVGDKLCSVVLVTVLRICLRVCAVLLSLECS